jgi:2-polyprenyl-6-methoxyphenol hydroxylase-like FAD-dependent oxidoreductase
VVKQTPAGGHFQGNKNELLEVLRDFPSPVPQIVEATPPETIAGQDIRDLRPLERWTTDRLTLLGDAAHAMTPNLGRGASEAIEDGISLAGFLSRVDRTDRVAVRDALAAFEERRRGATTPIQKRSNRLGWLLSQRFPGYVPMRERVMKQVTARVMPKKVEREFAAMASERDEGRSVASPSAS